MLILDFLFSLGKNHTEQLKSSIVIPTLEEVKLGIVLNESLIAFEGICHVLMNTDKCKPFSQNLQIELQPVLTTQGNPSVAIGGPPMAIGEKFKNFESENFVQYF